MVIKEMHYDVRTKLNEIDSSKYRKLKVPEIDWKLNLAQELLIKNIAEPHNNDIGFEFNQRTIDDIRSIVVNQKYKDGIVATIYDEEDHSYLIELPDDYMSYLNSKVYANKGTCSKMKLQTKIIKHDDETESSDFYKSSLNWRLANIRFIKEGLRVFTSGEFDVDRMCLEYIYQPVFMHNAQDFEDGKYTNLRGEVLTGAVDCELPVNTHSEIVNLAVFMIANDLSLPNVRNKQAAVELDRK